MALFKKSESFLLIRTLPAPVERKYFPITHEGLFAIFQQFSIEAYPEGMVPSGIYTVTRTKYPFKSAVFSVVRMDLALPLFSPESQGL